MTTPATPVDLDAIAALAGEATPLCRFVGCQAPKDAPQHRLPDPRVGARVTRHVFVEGPGWVLMPSDVALALVGAARALPRDGWFHCGMFVQCYSCGVKYEAGGVLGYHSDTCRWRIASDALRGVPPAREEGARP